LLLKSIRFSLEPLSNIDRTKNKTQDLLLNTSSGNRVMHIAGYRPAQEFDSKEHDTNQSHEWATFMCTLIRLSQINQHNYQQSW